jgi:hypothetical protein
MDEQERAREVATWKKTYPNLDTLIIECMLSMSDEQHLKFQQGLQNPTYEDSPSAELIQKS